MIQIVKDINVLKQVSEPVKSVLEAIGIADKLKETLDRESNGVGLAAIQLNIPKTISVLKKEFFANKEYFYLINPKILEAEDKFLFGNEGCLSFPGQFFNTWRYKHLTIENSRIEGDKFEKEKLYFYYPNINDKEDSKFSGDNGIICVAIQHEIDHFEGRIIPEYCVKNEPIQRENVKVGRNEPCPCGARKSNGEPVKYKKCCGKSV